MITIPKNGTISLKPSTPSDWTSKSNESILPIHQVCLEAHGVGFIRTNIKEFNEEIKLLNNNTFEFKFDLTSIDIKTHDRAFIAVFADSNWKAYQITAMMLQNEFKDSCNCKPSGKPIKSTTGISNLEISDFQSYAGKTIKLKIFLETKNNGSSDKSKFDISEIRISGKAPSFFKAMIEKVSNLFSKTNPQILDVPPPPSGNPDSGTTGPRRPPM